MGRGPPTSLGRATHVIRVSHPHVVGVAIPMSLGQSNSCHWVSLCHWAFLKCHEGNPHVIGTCSHVIGANQNHMSFPIRFSTVFRRNSINHRTSFHFLVKFAKGSMVFHLPMVDKTSELIDPWMMTTGAGTVMFQILRIQSPHLSTPHG